MNGGYNFKELIDGNDIIYGVVIKVGEAKEEKVSFQEFPMVVSNVTVRVKEWLKGKGAEKIIVKQSGGQNSKYIVTVSREHPKIEGDEGIFVIIKIDCEYWFYGGDEGTFPVKNGYIFSNGYLAPDRGRMLPRKKIESSNSIRKRKMPFEKFKKQISETLKNQPENN